MCLKKERKYPRTSAGACYQLTVNASYCNAKSSGGGEEVLPYPAVSAVVACYVRVERDKKLPEDNKNTAGFKWPLDLKSDGQDSFNRKFPSSSQTVCDSDFETWARALQMCTMSNRKVASVAEAQESLWKRPTSFFLSFTFFRRCALSHVTIYWFRWWFI